MSKRTRLIGGIVLVVSVALVLSACAPGANNFAHVGGQQIAGFWLGLWHGLISPVTFLISLFNHSINIYEVHNNGGWYNFGFMIGVSCIFSGPSHSASSARRSRRGRAAG